MKAAFIKQYITERRAGQMEAACLVQLSIAFGRHSRRWLIQTYHCQILSF